MVKKFCLSFKETTKDRALREAIKELEEPCVTIKDILYKILVEKRDIL